MITTSGQTVDLYVEQFERAAARAGRGPLARLLPLRQAALERFVARGFPTARDEDWRSTSLADLARTPFEPAEPAGPQLGPADLAPLAPAAAGPRLVLVNGRHAPHLSTTGGLPPDALVTDLAGALAEERLALDGHLARYADGAAPATAALNTALFEDAAVVWIPPGLLCAAPIHILHVAVPGRRPAVAHPRVLVVLGEGGAAEVVEDYVSVADGAHFTNAVTELVVGPGARLAYCKAAREALRVSHIATVQSHQERDSALTASLAVLGGALVRNDLRARLAGPGADCALHGLTMLAGTQHADNHLRVEHAAPHTSSREVFRAVLDGAARGIFHGRILVHPGAQKTDAKQTSMNLLLSPAAQAESQPQLEIRADDVKCTHGATIGQVDEEAVFYLRSRGLGAEAARNLLVYAFARAGLEAVRSAPLRARLEDLVRARLPHGGALHDLP